ncbi:MAG: ribonuclease Z [Thermodesulfobacteriaceae bacterium]|nr:ribonuclease Z [Thermodesulfobacteriaceae bacterium]MCX8042029.1 ribonuclease Z [Thermodesulfobacteriaceae bacterium]MDW8135358.1 ribonuclease Z [Thermodesulfobacterium sp.]
MKLTILGSGTGWIRVERNAPGYLVQVENFYLLLDCGPGVLKQLLKKGYQLEDISAIFISHFHPDHLSDLIPLFFATRYNLGYHRREPFTLYAGKGFLTFYQKLKEAFGIWVSPPEGLLKIEELPLIENYSFYIGPFKAQTSPVKHNPESLALRLEHQGKTLVYSGDTGFCEQIVKLSKKVDLLILECSNSENFSVNHHLGPQEIASIVEKTQVKTLVLSHFYPHSENPNIELIKKSFKGEIILAEDLMEINL